jgi:hypothetical protein
MFGSNVEASMEHMRALSTDGEVRYMSGMRASQKRFVFRHKAGYTIEVPFMVAARGVHSTVEHIDKMLTERRSLGPPHEHIDLFFKPHPRHTGTALLSSDQQEELRERIAAHIKSHAGPLGAKAPPRTIEGHRLQFVLVSRHLIDGEDHALWMVHHHRAPR